jgi:hypothetical protein
MDFSMSSVNRIADKAELPLGAAGFIIGAVGKDIELAQTQGVWDTYSLENKAQYILHNLIGRTTGIGYMDDVFAKGPRSTYNLTGFMNTGLWIAIASYFYKELGLPYANTVHKIMFPLGAGWAIGGFFDPPYGPSQAVRASTSNIGSYF